MILAGIDEAGLGPALGPLCVCRAALRVPDATVLPSLWHLLENSVTAKKRKGDDRLLVADSKVAHKLGGVAGLEKTFFSFLSQLPDLAPVSREELLRLLNAGEAFDSLYEYPWYVDAVWDVPALVPVMELSDSSARLKVACAAAGVTVASLAADIALAGNLNRRFDMGLNKSEAVLERTGAHLVAIEESFPDEHVYVTVDKQGGRNDYLPFLSNLFPGAWIEEDVAGADLSAYMVRRRGGKFRMEFMPRADAQSFPVALASIMAKYLRERFMADLNRFFQKELPGLKPTAGYHGDAPRFLAEIESVLLTKRIDTRLLIRER